MLRLLAPRNGVEIHCAIGGAGEPVFLLNGVPKRAMADAFTPVSG
jgi:hypothetical protein